MTRVAGNLGLFSSTREDWTTPTPLFLELDSEFDFTLDPCATPENAKCDLFYTREDDGLAQPWAPHRVFMNPPYGREIPAWVAKAHHESTLGAVVVCLVPARTDTGWFHNYVYRKHETRFIRGRLSFGGDPEKGHNAPFPSMLVVMRPSDAWGWQ